MCQVVVDDRILLRDGHILELSTVGKLGLREVAHGGFTVISIPQRAFRAAVEVNVLPVEHIVLAWVLLQHGMAARFVRLSMDLLKLGAAVDRHDGRLNLRHEVYAELVIVTNDLPRVAAGRGTHLGRRLCTRRDSVHRFGGFLNRLVI